VQILTLIVENFHKPNMVGDRPDSGICLGEFSQTKLAHSNEIMWRL